MSWPQVTLALNDKRRELCLTGKEFNEHLEKHGLDPELFRINSLNYLTIHNTTLQGIHDDIGELKELQTLSLHSNKINAASAGLEKLEKLKILDLSRNCITLLNINLNTLEHLTTINISNNRLESFPSVEKCPKLQVIDLSQNALTEFPPICFSSLSVLSDVKLGNNQIVQIPPEIDLLCSLKNLDVSANKVVEVPYNLANCAKLKELNLKENPIKDRRFLKLIDQCRTKQVLDYIKHAPRNTGTKQGTEDAGGNDGKKKGRGKQSSINELAALATDDAKFKLVLRHADISDDALKIIIKEEVKAVRPNIVCCLLHGLKFTEETFKKFIQLQNKLHETLCEKRNAATIATHDLKAMQGCKLVYTAVKPQLLAIKPLNSSQTVTGVQLFDKLQAEAEQLRREKKRNVYSGIHKYLYLLEGKPVYACLVKEGLLVVGGDVLQEVISFPPITNSDISKVTLQTESILLEVTSHANMPLTRKIADTVLQKVVHLMAEAPVLTVEQLRVVDVEGNMKTVYPSKTDLVFDPSASIAVVCE